MQESTLPKQYVEKSAAWLQQLNLMRLPRVDMPEEMRDPNIQQEDDWTGWRIIPSTVSSQELDELEARIGLTFPPYYHQFLQSYHFCELVGMGFCRHPIHKWRQELLFLYEAYSGLPLSRGLLPFGEEPMMDAGPVCFDTRNPMEDGDCPVVFWDHDGVGTDKEICLLFSCSAVMFRCLNFMAEAEVNFIYHDEDDPPEELPLKQGLMAEFLALDPEGAGGVARDYWTAWGVNPKIKL